MATAGEVTRHRPRRPAQTQNRFHRLQQATGLPLTRGPALRYCRARCSLTEGADMNAHRNAPDPEGLAIAREIQNKVRPAEIILGGSRAAGDHQPDSDVDLMAICPDEDTVREADEILR